MFKKLHQLSERITGFLSAGLDAAENRLNRLPDQNTALRIFLLIQCIVIAAAFLFTKARGRLLLNIFYCTTPGSVMGLGENIINIGTAKYANGFYTFPDGTVIPTGFPMLRYMFVGDNIAWLMSGIQAMFVAWYTGLVEKRESNRLFRAVHALLFTFFIGIVITAVLKLLARIPLPGGAAGLPFFLIGAIMLIAVFIVALDNFIANFKMILVLVPLMYLVSLLFSKSLQAIVKLLGGPDGTVGEINDAYVRSPGFVLFCAGALIVSYLISKRIDKYLKAHKAGGQNARRHYE